MPFDFSEKAMSPNRRESILKRKYASNGEEALAYARMRNRISVETSGETTDRSKFKAALDQISNRKPR
ncbi:hypothetical protein PO124_31975 [Bacillus licheniformis]|nr:hypothetical protein [Bacillus licheniformis]